MSNLILCLKSCLHLPEFLFTPLTVIRKNYRHFTSFLSSTRATYPGSRLELGHNIKSVLKNKLKTDSFPLIFCRNRVDEAILLVIKYHGRDFNGSLEENTPATTEVEILSNLKGCVNSSSTTNSSSLHSYQKLIFDQIPSPSGVQTSIPFPCL